MSLRRPAIRRIALALAMIVVTAPTLPSQADTLFGPPDNAGDVMPLDRSGSRAAREELARARVMLTRARINSANVHRITEMDLRNQGGYKSLQIVAAQTINAYNAARRPVLARLARDAEYAKLYSHRDALRREMRAIADAKTLDYDKLVPLAVRALETGERLTRSEQIELASDPAVEDARAAMTDAFAALRRVTGDARARAIESPAVAMSREDIAHARERVTMANQNLVAALRAEAAADRARDRRSGRSRGA